jgi:hypothetical protein
MITGRQALASLDQALNEARTRIDAVEVQIDAVNQKLVAQHTARAEDYKELARIRVDLLADGELVHLLDRAEQQVVGLLGQRDAALQDLLRQIEVSEEAHQALEAERAVQARQVDAAAEAVDAADALTQARLDADPGYRAQRDKAHDVERKAMHAEEKAVRSEEEREQKGASYRGDALFMYLWERRYGLPEYRAGGLIRWLDGKVARLIGFADARANYSRLNEIPVRLREYADGLKTAAETEFQALKELDTSAREADGVAALEQRLAEEHDRLDAIDQRIVQADSDQQALLERKAAFASGDDPHTRQAVQFLASEFQRNDLMELRRAVMTTPFPDDDIIVSRLLEREDERRRLEASLQGLRETISQHQKRLSELETLRVDFKRRRYDRAGSAFGDDAMIGMMLGQFLHGLLDRQTLWKVLQEQQHYRPRRSDPTFGSGGFGRGSVWGGGVGDLRDLSDIVGGLRRGGGGLGGRRRGGGFRTGGGF